jgi:hypothetical protein
MPKPMQLSMFPKIIKQVELKADSKKSAFYRIEIVEEGGEYSVEKYSGIHDKVLDHRKWPMQDIEKCEKFVNRKIREKTNEQRKSRRIYKMSIK